MEMLRDPEFWVGVGTLIFLAVLLWQKVPAVVTKALDARAATIAKELDDARRLREEAEALLADYKRKTAGAESEAAAIVAEAKAEAERFAAESQAAIKTQIERRAKQAEQKIAQAEAQALQEVRALSAEVAISASEKILGAKVKGSAANTLIARSIGEVKSKLN